MSTLNILIFSWRDIKNPKAGGAEILTWELGIRWVKKGHSVTIISALFPNGNKKEIVEGIKIYRPAFFYQYSPFSYLIYFYKTMALYRQKFMGKCDIVIDQVHGIPFFTPFFVKEKVIVFPLEIAKQIWFYEIPFPFSLIGYLLEILYIKLFRKVPFMVISQSVASQLHKMGVKKTFTIACGNNIKPIKTLPRKDNQPTLVMLGRITKMKRIEDMLAVLKLLITDFPDTKLIIVGCGQMKYISKLKKLCQKLSISESVVFTGFVDEKEKRRLLAKAWILVSTSAGEGWGLNVIEAASCSTPSVVYQVSGLVDSVKNGVTGIVCQKNTPVVIAKELRKLLTDDELRSKLSQNALKYSKNFDWDKTAIETLELFTNYLHVKN